MSSEIPELQAIRERLLELELQNRRLKRSGFAILVVLSAVILMGQVAPTPRVVEAQRFVIKDKDGKERGWLGTIGKGSQLTLGNVNAEPMMRLIVSTDASDLHFFGSRQSGMNLGVDSGNPDISIAGAEQSGEARLTFGEEGPSLKLEDAKGSSTILGAAELPKPATGEAHPASAASIVMLDKNKNLLWHTP